MATSSHLYQALTNDANVATAVASKPTAPLFEAATMVRSTLTLCAALFTTPLLAAPLSCEQLKAEIEVKIQSAGVTAYTLEIVPNAEARDPTMVVGSCANGTHKILYQRND